MNLLPKTTYRRPSAFSLVEMLVVIAVIGILASIAIPMVSNMRDSSNDGKDRANARSVESLSLSLAAMGVAHVIPESLGGAEATARLLREGVTVSSGPFSGQMFQLPGMSDEDVAGAARFLNVAYDISEVRLVYEGQLTTGIESNSSPSHASWLLAASGN